MALLKRFRNLRSEENTGFGNNSTNLNGRFFNRQNGAANVKRAGIPWLNKLSWYHTMLGMRLWKFLLLLFTAYISINFIFAGIYYLIGIEHLSGIEKTNSLNGFSEVFFFSTQTFTTVGYGRVSPTGFLTNAIATFEAFLGLLSFAIATGLFYGRFSRPQAFLKFSHHALFAPYNNGIALMFRLTPYKNNNLSDAEVKITLAMQVDENGVMKNKFYNLPIEIDKINSLALSWTIVHAIDEKSPLWGITAEELKASTMELLVYVKAFDEVFSNTVVSRWSYHSTEMIWGGKFKSMFYTSKDESHTILNIEQLNEYESVNLPSFNN